MENRPQESITDDKISIRIVDSYGRPLNGIAYRLELSNIRGVTDDNGMIIEEGCVPGDRVHFIVNEDMQ